MVKSSLNDPQKSTFVNPLIMLRSSNGKWNIKIVWVRWWRPCMSENDSGFMARDIGLVNFALFGNWRWRKFLRILNCRVTLSYRSMASYPPPLALRVTL